MSIDRGKRRSNDIFLNGYVTIHVTALLQDQSRRELPAPVPQYHRHHPSASALPMPLLKHKATNTERLLAAVSRHRIRLVFSLRPSGSLSALPHSIGSIKLALMPFKQSGPNCDWATARAGEDGKMAAKETRNLECEQINTGPDDRYCAVL
jgi:hypothetical protein